jgi:hypothetical protein
VKNQSAVALGLAYVQGLLKTIQNEVGLHRSADSPADNAPSEDINDEGNAEPALPGRKVREVRHPELVLPLDMELPADPVQRARSLAVTDGRAHGLAPPHAFQTRSISGTNASLR